MIYFFFFLHFLLSRRHKIHNIESNQGELQTRMRDLVLFTVFYVIFSFSINFPNFMMTSDKMMTDKINIKDNKERNTYWKKTQNLA